MHPEMMGKGGLLRFRRAANEGCVQPLEQPEEGHGSRDRSASICSQLRNSTGLSDTELQLRFSRENQNLCRRYPDDSLMDGK